MIFNIHPTNQKNITVENLQIRFLFQEKSPQQPQQDSLLRQQLHTHSFAELFACLSEQILIRDYHGTVHALLAGDLAIVPSGVKHMMLSDPTSRAEWIAIGITVQRAPSSETADFYGTAELLLDGGEITLYRNRPHLCKLMQDCHRQSNQKEFSTLLTFLAEFIKLPAASAVGTKKEHRKKAKNIDRLLKLDDIINMNFSQNFSNEEIAKLLFISKRQLSRIVEENYGEPLRKILLKRRLQGAAALLRTSDQPVEKIAYRIGFTNKNTFFREFKKLYGCTPLAWRRSGNR